MAAAAVVSGALEARADDGRVVEVHHARQQLHCERELGRHLAHVRLRRDKSLDGLLQLLVDVRVGGHVAQRGLAFVEYSSEAAA